LPVALKSVSALRDMRVGQRSGHLEFDDDLVLDIRSFADDHVVVIDRDCPLSGDAETGLSRLVSKSVLVDRFNAPMAERIADPESAADDPLGRRLQQPRIPLHPAHPP
jgi:hypothetical protein